MARRLPTLVVPKAANIPAGDVTGPEWLGLTARVDTVAPVDAPSPSEFAANIAGQMVWVKMPHIDPTLSQFGMSESNTDAANDAALLAAANAAVEAGATVKIPDGSFPLKQVSMPYGAIIEGAGKGRTQFRRTTAISGNGPTLIGEGSVGTAIPLAAATARNATSFTVATNPGLVAGDVVYLTDTRTIAGGTMPGHDMATVLSVTGTGPFTVKLGNALYHPFDPALSATMQKVNLWRGGFHGFSVDVVGGIAANGIALTYAGSMSEVGDVEIKGWMSGAIALKTCFMTKIDRTSVANPASTSGSNGYGHRFDFGTRGVDVGHSESRGARHGFDISSGSSDNVIHDSFGYDPGVGPDFLTHGAESYHNQFVNCTASAPTVNMGFNAGNATFGGDFYTVFDRCTGFGAGPTGPAVGMFRAIQGSTGTRWSNCTVVGARYAYQISNTNDCAIVGGRTSNMQDGVYVLNSSGTTVTGHQFKDGTISGVREPSASSNYTLVTANQFENCTASPVQLAGANSLGTNNIAR